jgi:hypothetical protein
MVGNFFGGVYDPGKETVKGIVTVVANPVQTAKGVAKAATNPGETASLGGSNIFPGLTAADAAGLHSRHHKRLGIPPSLL